MEAKAHRKVDRERLLKRRLTWRDAADTGSHLIDTIAIAVQRCNGKVQQASVEMEARVALGAAAA